MRVPSVSIALPHAAVRSAVLPGAVAACVDTPLDSCRRADLTPRAQTSSYAVATPALSSTAIAPLDRRDDVALLELDRRTVVTRVDLALPGVSVGGSQLVARLDGLALTSGDAQTAHVTPRAVRHSQRHIRTLTRSAARTRGRTRRSPPRRR